MAEYTKQDNGYDGTGYDGTISFYRGEEVFTRFLGQASYYLGLQRNLLKLVQIIKPNRVIEFGFGTGKTAVEIAKSNPGIEVVGLEIRDNMIVVAEGLAKGEGVTNTMFLHGDMIDYVKQDMSSFDLLFLLYNFHHIKDSDYGKEKEKTEFLRDCYKNMKVGAMLCIADLFIPEQNGGLATKEGRDALMEWFYHRSKEGHASTFWSSLEGLEKEQIAQAKEIARYCESKEYENGTRICNLEFEFPIKKSWLSRVAQEQKFTQILNEEINTLGEAILLFRK